MPWAAFSLKSTNPTVKVNTKVTVDVDEDILLTNLFPYARQNLSQRCTYFPTK